MAAPQETPTARYHDTVRWRIADRLATWADHRWGWHALPTPLGLLVLIGVRDVLRRHNLYDTTAEPGVGLPLVPGPDPRQRTERTTDGSWNDLGVPRMGMAGSRFGRNVPPQQTAQPPRQAVLTPSPREVSRALLTRTEFVPATSVNALVAAWLQFMIHDWFSHGKSPKDDPWEVRLLDDDPWPDRPMRIMRTRPDPTRPAGAAGPATYANTETHWWDASQIYGSTPDWQAFVRTREGGKLRVDADGTLPFPADPDSDPSRVPGFWVGLLMMQTLFTLEHNAICDRLRAEYPTWSDEDLFQRARLVNAALIAKIHTVEWTPAVISHPTTKAALRANWWGLAGERVYRTFGRLSSSEVLSGIPGSKPQHYGIPYALTEEFVAVYRMHPLVPDDFSLRAVADDSVVRACTFRDVAGPEALGVVDQVGLGNLFYSFGTQHPGLVCLHNFPRFMQEFERPDGILQDLGATDILRSRELGVPRYNQFRRLLHLRPARDFDDLTDNPEWAREIERVYAGDIEEVDVSVGMFAEKRPAGFAFSDTAFRIFVLMASRRLNSDRFFTSDYTPAVYTRAGMAWIDDNTMATVLLRHYPQLRPAMRAAANAFVPWERTGR